MTRGSDFFPSKKYTDIFCYHGSIPSTGSISPNEINVDNYNLDLLLTGTSSSGTSIGSLESCSLTMFSGMAVLDNSINVTTLNSDLIFSIVLDRESLECCSKVQGVNTDQSREIDFECRSNENCGLGMEFGPLERFNMNWGGFRKRPIDVIQEDRYKPGTYYINSRTTIKRIVPGEPITLVVGNETQEDVNRGYKDGPSSVAEFSLISSFVQFNQTRMAIGDFQNGCVRLYDSATDIVSTIVGTCDSFGRGIAQNAWDTYDENTVKDSLDAQFSGVLTIILLERWNKLLVLDNAFKVIIQNDFVTKKTSVLDVALVRKCPRPLNVIADAKEDNIYINHAYGVTRYNIDKKESILLFGMIDVSANGGSDITLIPGPFKIAQTGALDSFSWLVPDKILVTMGRMSNEAIVIIDLEQEHIYSLCDGRLL